MNRCVYRIQWTVKILASAVMLSLCASCATTLDDTAKTEGRLISSKLSRVVTNMPPHKYEIDGTAKVVNGKSMHLEVEIKAFQKQQRINKNTYSVDKGDSLKAAIVGGFMTSGDITRDLYEPAVRVVTFNPIPVLAKVTASINGVTNQRQYAVTCNKTNDIDLSEQVKQIVPPEPAVSSFEILVTVDDPPAPGEASWDLAPSNWSDSIIVLAEFGNKDAAARLQKKQEVIDTYARWKAEAMAPETLRYSSDEFASVFVPQQRREQAVPMAARAGALANMIETLELMGKLTPDEGAGYGQRLKAAAKQSGKEVGPELMLFARALDNDPELTFAERDKVFRPINSPIDIVMEAEALVPGFGRAFRNGAYSELGAEVVSITVTMGAESIMTMARQSARGITIPGVEAALQSEARGAIIEKYVYTLYNGGNEPQATAALRDALVEECGMDVAQATSVALKVASAVATTAIDLYVGKTAVDLAKYVGFSRAFSKCEDRYDLYPASQ